MYILLFPAEDSNVAIDIAGPGAKAANLRVSESEVRWIRRTFPQGPHFDNPFLQSGFL